MKRLIFIMTALAAIAFSLNAQENVWANFSRYADANKQVLEAQKNGASKPLAVLMGDSITDGWYNADKAFFTDNNLLGRGISGQCTSHMLVRFQRDVVELQPKYVAILAGINDIAHNANYVDVEDALLNIVSMCDIADRYKIKVVLCTTTPGNPGWRPELKNMHEQAVWLNEQIRQLAKDRHYKLADYAAALQDETGMTSSKYSKDTVHPNLDGYKVMEELLLKVLKKK
jgi:alpha-L-fucosidase